MSLTDEDKKWIRDQIREHASASEERLRHAIERVETALLTEFHKWASPTEARLRSHSAVMRALDMEVERLDERVRRLEGEPPPA